MTIEIPLVNGGVTIIDDVDLSIVNAYRWKWLKPKRNKYPFAATSISKKIVPMHRLIMDVLDAGRAVQIDHKNCDGLDNRRENLRVATASQNGANKRLFKGLPYKGVILRKDHDCPTFVYRARIRVNGRLFHLGNFKTAIEAACAYDVAAVKYFGEFSRLNFPW